MNACGKFNWIFDVFKLRRSEREILAPASRAPCGMWHRVRVSRRRLRSPARQLVMLQSKLIFNASQCHSAFLFMWQERSARAIPRATACRAHSTPLNSSCSLSISRSLSASASFSLCLPLLHLLVSLTAALCHTCHAHSCSPYMHNN